MNRRDEKMRDSSFPGAKVIGRWIAPEWPKRLTPARLLLILSLSIFVAEFIIILLMSQLPPVPRETKAIIDATVLLLLLSPAYFFLYLPLKRHYTEHLRSDREIRLLSNQLIRAIEDEKKRLARDLHDDCGGTLTALQFGIEALRNSLTNAGPEERRQLDFLRELVGQLGDNIRAITSDLRPPLLENCGLAATLTWHAEQFKSNGCDFHIEMELEECPKSVGADIEIALFRVFQEGLNNVAKHAFARRVKVRLFCDAERVGLILDDDGRGFCDTKQPKTAEIQPGAGLVGMRERITALGGNLTISSAPGKGTRIWARIPLHDQDFR